MFLERSIIKILCSFTINCLKYQPCFLHIHSSSGFMFPLNLLKFCDFPWLSRKFHDLAVPSLAHAKALSHVHQKITEIYVGLECHFFMVYFHFPWLLTFLKISWLLAAWKSVIQIPWLFQVSMTAWILWRRGGGGKLLFTIFPFPVRSVYIVPAHHCSFIYWLQSVWFQVGNEVNAISQSLCVHARMSLFAHPIRSAWLGLHSNFNTASSKVHVDVATNLESYRLYIDAFKANLTTALHD